MRAAFFLALAPLVLAVPAAAQEISVDLEDVSDAVEIVRDVDITDVVRPRPDQDSVDTALVFTNKLAFQSAVKCVGIDAKGNPAGRAWSRIAPNGLAIIFASDLTDGADVIGSVRCKSRPSVVGSGFLLSPGSITDVPVQQRRAGRSAKSIHFPVVATY